MYEGKHFYRSISEDFHDDLKLWQWSEDKASNPWRNCAPRGTSGLESLRKAVNGGSSFRCCCNSELFSNAFENVLCTGLYVCLVNAWICRQNFAFLESYFTVHQPIQLKLFPKFATLSFFKRVAVSIFGIIQCYLGSTDRQLLAIVSIRFLQNRLHQF